jgi:hypothetical protein
MQILDYADMCNVQPLLLHNPCRLQEFRWQKIFNSAKRFAICGCSGV